MTSTEKMRAEKRPEVAQQRAYYAQTAAKYDERHAAEPEHGFALGVLCGVLDHLAIESVLDVGAGTGRVMRHLAGAKSKLSVVGLEPVEELRRIAVGSGVRPEQLVSGDAQVMPFRTAAFDLVCAFGVLHHLPRPGTAILEMLRVARRAVFISDANNFGQGGPAVRLAKQALDMVHLWPLANWLKTRGRGYSVTEGDGISYSYSVFNDYRILEQGCRVVHTVNTLPSGPNHYRSAPHVAVLGVK